MKKSAIVLMLLLCNSITFSRFFSDYADASAPTEIIMDLLKQSGTKYTGSDMWRSDLQEKEAHVETVLAVAGAPLYGLIALWYMPYLINGGMRTHFKIDKENDLVDIETSFEHYEQTYPNKRNQDPKDILKENKKQGKIQADLYTTCTADVHRATLDEKSGKLTWHSKISCKSRMSYDKMMELLHS